MAYRNIDRGVEMESSESLGFVQLIKSPSFIHSVIIVNMLITETYILKFLTFNSYESVADVIGFPYLRGDDMCKFNEGLIFVLNIYENNHGIYPVIVGKIIALGLFSLHVSWIKCTQTSTFVKVSL